MGHSALQQYVPLYWAQRVSIHGLIKYKIINGQNTDWHSWSNCYSMCWSSRGGKVLRWSQSTLLPTAVGQCIHGLLQ